VPECPYLYTCEKRVPLWYFNVYCLGGEHFKCILFKERKFKEWREELENKVLAKVPREWMFREVVG